MSKKNADSHEQMNLEEKVENLTRAVSKTKINLPPGWTRTTVTMREEHLQKLKDYAWWARSSPKNVLEKILEKFFSATDVPVPPKNKILDDE